MAPQVVQITINVTDGNASEAVQQVVTQLNAIGPAGAAAGQMASSGLDQISGHALTSLDNVRLLRDDLGIHIPRSMERAIAQSAVLSNAIGTMGSGLLALGAAEIFVHMGEALYGAYEKYIDLNGAQSEFLKTMQENKDKDFVNVHSIETARVRIDEATAAMTSFDGVAKEMSKTGWSDIFNGNVGIGIGEIFGARQMAGLGAKGAGQTQELSPQEQGLIHQLNMQNIESAHAGDSALQGQAKITSELQKQLDIDKEKQRYTGIEDKEKGNIGGSKSGGEMRAAEDLAATRKAMAEETELERQYADQVIQMQNEATNAGLEGNALRAQQEIQAIDAVTREFKRGKLDEQTAMRETAAIDNKFGAEALKLQQQLDEQTKHLSDEANQAGMKGMQLLSAQLQTQLDAIDAAERKAVGPGGIETAGQTSDFNSQRNSARQISFQKGIEEQAQYEQQIRSLMDSSDDSELQGYARIEADTRKHLDELSKADSDYYSNAGTALEAYQSQAMQVEANADRARAQLHQRAMEQITKEEQQAARDGLPEWLQAQQAIVDAYSDRYQEIKRIEDQQLASTKNGSDLQLAIEKEADQQILAARQTMNAQIQKADEETRDKLASGLQSLFSHPEKFFEETAMKTGFQLMANEMLSIFQSSGPTGGILQYLFGMGPQMNTSTNPLTAMSSALGLGHHSSGATGMTGNATFQQGSTTLLTGSQALLQAATALQTATGTMGGGATAGMGIGGFGMGGSTVGGASSLGMGTGASPDAISGMPAFSTGSGMVGSSPMPETMDDPLAGSINANGTFTAASQSAGSLGTYAGIAGGALMGATSIYSAYQNSNPIAGAAGGLAGGMQVGSSIGMLAGGPAGALLGGAIGAIAGGIGGLFAGIFGDQGKGQAEGLDVNTIQPELLKDMQDYQTGRSGYSAIAADLNNLLRSSQNSTSTWGSGARNYYNSNIVPEINAAISSLQKQEAGGRSAVTLSAGQFHSGGVISGFGDLSTSDTEGFIHAMRNEMVMNPAATSAHAPILHAMNSGMNFGYSGTTPSRIPANAAGGGGQITIQALDSKSFAQWSKAGGGRALVSSLNQAQTQYSGKGR